MDQEQEEALAEASRLLSEALAQGPQHAKAATPDKMQVGNVLCGPVTIHELTQNFS